MDSTEKTLITLEELTDILLPKGTPERECHDIKLDIIKRLGKILGKSKFYKTDIEKINYLQKSIQQLIISI